MIPSWYPTPRSHQAVFVSGCMSHFLQHHPTKLYAKRHFYWLHPHVYPSLLDHSRKLPASNSPLAIKQHHKSSHEHKLHVALEHAYFSHFTFMSEIKNWRLIFSLLFHWFDVLTCLNHSGNCRGNFTGTPIYGGSFYPVCWR